MALSESEILQILKMVEESDFGELRLEAGDLKLVVRKKGYRPEADCAPPAAKAPERRAERTAPPGPSKKAERQGEEPASEEGTVAVKSPMLGTFYRRPSPDAPPYVEVGSSVKEDDTVCLIEVMKVFTAVKAGVSGVVTGVLVETNEMVEYGQPLFLVRPA